MRRLPTSALALIVAIVVTMFSALYERAGGDVVQYEGVEPGPSYTHVIVGGWPVPYIYDKICCSPRDRADWTGVVLGLDEFRLQPFVIDVAIYFVPLWLLTRWIRRKRGTVARDR